MQHVFAIAGLVGLCSVWILVQEYFRKHDAGAPGVEGKCGSCGVPCAPEKIDTCD